MGAYVQLNSKRYKKNSGFVVPYTNSKLLKVSYYKSNQLESPTHLTPLNA